MLLNELRSILQSKETTTYLPDTPLNSAKSDTDHTTKRKNIFINLAKLHAGTLQSLQDESMAFELATERTYMSHDGTRPFKEKPKKKKPEPKRKVDVRQFLGPVVETCPTPEDELMGEDMEAEDLPMVDFRLRGMRQREQG